MFTGIIQKVGTVSEIRNVHGNRLFTIQAECSQNDPFEKGESIAVDGVCLTVKDVFDFGFEVEAVKETLTRSTLRHFHPGQRVNLERSLRINERLGGHIVLGHVDSTGVIKNIERDIKNVTVHIKMSPRLRPYLVYKGSVAVNGVSLTISDLKSFSFGVSLVEYTLFHTNLANLKADDEVNLEVDVLARYIESLLKGSSKRARKLDYIRQKGLL